MNQVETKSRFVLALRALSRVAGYKLRRAMRVQPRHVGQVAAREWILSPAAVEPAIRPIIPDDHLNRILGGPAGVVTRDILASLNASSIEHAATRAYLIRDGVLMDRAIYSGMGKLDLFRGMGLVPSLVTQTVGDIPEAVWATTYSGTRWFGHFLHDEIPLQELARGMGPMLGHVRPVYRHEPGWRSAMQVPAPRLFGLLRVKELTWIEDFGQNGSKRNRYALLRSRLAANPMPGHERILLLRGRSEGEERRIVNEDEVISALSRRGFHVIDQSRAGVEDLLRNCLRAKIVVTVDGSHAAPALYLVRTGGTIVFLYPPTRVSVILPRLTQVFGLQAGMFIGSPVEEGGAAFRVDPLELVRMLEDTRIADPSHSH